MFTIGDFARLGQVSVRMLRHYDAGLHGEVYLHYADGEPDTWATELQVPVRTEER